MAQPVDVACSFATSTWHGALHLTSDSEAIADVHCAEDARIEIPEGDADRGAFISFKAVGMDLSGITKASDVSIQLKQPKLLGGYAWTRLDTEFQWVQASHGRITLKLSLDPRVRPTAGALTVECSCNDVTMNLAEVANYDERSNITSRKTVLETAWVGEPSVPLSLKPGGPPVALLDTRPENGETEPDSVVILDASGTYRRIVHSLDSVVLIGWVPTSALRRHLERVDWSSIGLLYTTAPWSIETALYAPPGVATDPTQALARTQIPRGTAPVCAWNSPFIAESQGVMRSLGTLASAIPLIASGRRGGLREVALHHPDLTTSASARFWVPEQMLYPCDNSDPTDGVGPSQ